MLGGEYFNWHQYTLNARTENSPSDDIPTLNAGSNRTYTYSYKEGYRILSGFARVNYNYNYKYLLSVVARYDGISKLRDNRWGFFPSVSAGWVISQENFMEKANDIVDILKLRVSYGLLGNQNIGNYPYASTINPGYGYYLGDNKELTPGVAQIALSNADITWEKSKQFDLGMDLSMWNGLLTVTADYYIMLV